jgi:transposase
MKRYFLGVDISKDILTVYDGKELRKFKNKRGLKEFKKFLKHKFKELKRVILIFEPTGAYSAFLREFCWLNRIKAVILNPRKVPYLLEVIGNRAKTDRLDAILLYKYKDIVREEEIRVPELNETVEKLSIYLSTYKMILKQKRALKNHLEFLETAPFATEKLKKMK